MNFNNKSIDFKIFAATLAISSLLVLIAYFPILGFYFELEDWGVFERLAARQPGLLSFWSTEWENYFRPVEWMFYYASYSVFDVEPQPYYAVSICHQVINSGLVYWFVRSLRGGTLLAAMAAIIFAVYPTVWEAVSWVVAAGHQFVVTNMLLAAIFSAMYFRHRNLWYYVGMLVFFSLSLCTREQSIMVLPTIALIHLYFLDRPVNWSREFKPYYILVSIFIVYALYQLQLQQENRLVSGGRYGLSLESISHWVGLIFNIFVPNKIAKALISPEAISWAKTNLLMVSIAALVVVVVLIRVLAYLKFTRSAVDTLLRSRFFYLSLALTSLHLFVYALFSTGGASSRYTYIGSIGASMVIAKLYVSLFQLSRGRRLKWIVSALFVGSLLLSIVNIRLGVETFHQRTNRVESALLAFDQIHHESGGIVVYNFLNPPYVDYAWHRAVSIRFGIPPNRLTSIPVLSAKEGVSNLYFNMDNQTFKLCSVEADENLAGCGA